MEALDASEEIIKSVIQKNRDELVEIYYKLLDKFVAEGWEVSSMAIQPLGPDTPTKQGLFYTWNPVTTEGKFYLIMAGYEPDMFSSSFGTKETFEYFKKKFIRYNELAFYYGDKADKMFDAEVEKEEAIKKEIEESAKKFQVFGG